MIEDMSSLKATEVDVLEAAVERVIRRLSKQAEVQQASSGAISGVAEASDDRLDASIKRVLDKMGRSATGTSGTPTVDSPQETTGTLTSSLPLGGVEQLSVAGRGDAGRDRLGRGEKVVQENTNVDTTTNMDIKLNESLGLVQGLLRQMQARDAGASQLEAGGSQHSNRSRQELRRVVAAEAEHGNEAPRSIFSHSGTSIPRRGEISGAGRDRTAQENTTGGGAAAVRVANLTRSTTSSWRRSSTSTTRPDHPGPSEQVDEPSQVPRRRSRVSMSSMANANFTASTFASGKRNHRPVTVAAPGPEGAGPASARNRAALRREFTAMFKERTGRNPSRDLLTQASHASTATSAMVKLGLAGSGNRRASIQSSQRAGAQRLQSASAVTRTKRKSLETALARKMTANQWGELNEDAGSSNMNDMLNSAGGGNDTSDGIVRTEEMEDDDSKETREDLEMGHLYGTRGLTPSQVVARIVDRGAVTPDIHEMQEALYGPIANEVVEVRLEQASPEGTSKTAVSASFDAPSSSFDGGGGISVHECERGDHHLHPLPHKKPKEKSFSVETSSPGSTAEQIQQPAGICP
ncbi:unnamed protein product [Amoebophrya sp. A25]|nr:unnamed protein product [Amoebophrya sp. A25]|eukprot:GSA25T00000991001.1